MDGQFCCGDAVETSNILDPREHSEAHELRNSVEHLLQTAHAPASALQGLPPSAPSSHGTAHNHGWGQPLIAAVPCAELQHMMQARMADAKVCTPMSPNIHSELKVASVASVVVVMGVGLRRSSLRAGCKVPEACRGCVHPEVYASSLEAWTQNFSWTTRSSWIR
jgi:hypothetical protein